MFSSGIKHLTYNYAIYENKKIIIFLLFKDSKSLSCQINIQNISKDGRTNKFVKCNWNRLDSV